MVRGLYLGSTPGLTATFFIVSNPNSLPKSLPFASGPYYIAVLLLYKNMATNPRHANGNLRRKHRARLKAMGGPCGICQGRLGPIHYDEPSDAQHPLSFVIDEIIPVSKWKQFGYDSPEAVARDWNNLQAAHWCCNAAKSNKTGAELRTIKTKANIIDGNW